MEESVRLEIIGPGFGRAGNHSLKIALEHLSFAPVIICSRCAMRRMEGH
jgi:hypothetical protein